MHSQHLLTSGFIGSHIYLSVYGCIVYFFSCMCCNFVLFNAPKCFRIVPLIQHSSYEIKYFSTERISPYALISISSLNVLFYSRIHFLTRFQYTISLLVPVSMLCALSLSLSLYLSLTVFLYICRIYDAVNIFRAFPLANFDGVVRSINLDICKVIPCQFFSKSLGLAIYSMKGQNSLSNFIVVVVTDSVFLSEEKKFLFYLRLFAVDKAILL